MNVISIGWNCYLSFLNSGAPNKIDEVIEEGEEKVEELIEKVKN